MIAGKKLKLTVMKMPTAFATDPETGRQVPTEFREELHLFIEPGGYCKHSDGVWTAMPPVKTAPPFRLATRKVEEHDDGTITVEGVFPLRDGTAWRLVKGDWVEVPKA